MGAGSQDHFLTFVKDQDTYGPYTMQGNTLGQIANQVSFYLHLRGTSMTLDTACSSSLVALDQAFQAIKSGSLDAALVIGVYLFHTNLVL